MTAAVVRIQHIATGDHAVVVRRHRLDVAGGEPHSLIAEDRLAPGAARTVTLQPGEVLTVQEDSAHV